MASPHRIFTETDLVLASHNAGKLREISALLEGRPFQVTSAADHDVPEPEETEESFIGNAVLKARHTVEATGKPAIADDSGLVVPALNGAPGIYSARWAGPDRDFIMAMQRVNSSLAATGGADRRAYFTCVLALAWPASTIHRQYTRHRLASTIRRHASTMSTPPLSAGVRRATHFPCT